jgi:hypothetical protein
MTIEELRKQTAIQQAWLRGKQIQIRRKTNGAEWFDMTLAASATKVWFEWDEYDYRIKPTPLVVYVPDCGGAVLGNSAYSAVQPGLYGVRRWHRFVEDIDFNGAVEIRIANERDAEHVDGGFS